jgi:hypothetical protein
MKTQVIFARMRESFSPGFFPFVLQASDLLPVDISKSILSRDNEFNLMRRDMFGIVSFSVPKSLCTCVFKVVKSQFEPGQIVIKKGCEIPFRITSIKWHRVDFWLQDGWGDSQNLASGAMESDVRLATDEEIVKNKEYISYCDGLMRKRDTFIELITLDSKVNDNGLA